MCVVIFYTSFFSETFLILRINKRDINVHRSHVNNPLFLSDFNETWIASTDFRQVLTVKIRAVGAGFCADRWAGRQEEANSRISQFCEHA